MMKDVNVEKFATPDMTNADIQKLHKKITKIRKKWNKMESVASKTNQNSKEGNLIKKSETVNNEKKKSSKKAAKETSPERKETPSKSTGDTGLIYYKKKKLKTPPPHEIKEGDVEEFISLEKVKKKRKYPDTESDADSAVKFIYHNKKRRRDSVQKDKENSVTKEIKLKKVSRKSTPIINLPFTRNDGENSGLKISGEVVKETSRKRTPTPTSTKKSRDDKPTSPPSNSEVVIEDFIKYVSSSQSSKNNPLIGRSPETQKKNFTIHNHESNEILEIENTIANFKEKHRHSQLDSMVDKWFEKDFIEKRNEKKKKKKNQTLDKDKTKQREKAKNKIRNKVDENSVICGDPFTSTPIKLSKESSDVGKQKRKGFPINDVSKIRKEKESRERENFYKKKKLSGMDVAKKKVSSYETVGANVTKGRLSVNETNSDSLKNENCTNNSTTKKLKTKQGAEENIKGKNANNTTLKKNDLDLSSQHTKKTPERKLKNKDKLLKKSVKNDDLLNGLIAELKLKYGTNELMKMLQNLSESSDDVVQSQKSKKSIPVKSGEATASSDLKIIENTQNSEKTNYKTFKGKNGLNPTNDNIRKAEDDLIVLSDSEVMSNDEKFINDETVILSSDAEEMSSNEDGLIKALRRYQRIQLALPGDEGVKLKTNGESGEDNSDVNPIDVLKKKTKLNGFESEDLALKCIETTPKINKSVINKNVLFTKDVIEVEDDVDDTEVIAIEDESTEKAISNSNKKIIIKENIVISTPDKANTVQTGKTINKQKYTGSTSSLKIVENSQILENNSKNEKSNINCIHETDYIDANLKQVESEGSVVNKRADFTSDESSGNTCISCGNVRDGTKRKKKISKSLIFNNFTNGEAQNCRNFNSFKSNWEILGLTNLKCGHNNTSMASEAVVIAANQKVPSPADNVPSKLTNSCQAAAIEANQKVPSPLVNWEFLSPKDEKFNISECSRDEEKVLIKSSPGSQEVIQAVPSQTDDNWKIDKSSHHSVDGNIWIKNSPISIKGDFNSDFEFSPVRVKLDEFDQYEEDTRDGNTDEDDGCRSACEDVVVDVIKEITFEGKITKVPSPDIFASQYVHQEV